MASATGLSRAAVKVRLRDIFENAAGLAGVTITYAQPTEPVAGLNLFLSDVRGALAVANMRAAPIAHDDIFTVDVVAAAWAPGVPDHEQPDADVGELIDAVRSELAAHPFLDDSQGTPLAGVVHAIPRDLEGPVPWRTAEGVGSVMRLSIEVHIRIT
jgi:hypothetical protein